MGKYKKWTKDEEFYLQDHWGQKSAALIARKLGRPYSAVTRKASDLGLLIPTLHYDGITVRQLSIALGVSCSTTKTWIQQYNFPSKQKIFSKKRRINVVSYQEFWEWAEEHKDLINFSKLEPLILGKEPDWVNEKRRVDRKKFKERRPWTNEDKSKLVSLVKSYQFTYPELASILKRPEASIRRKLLQLNIKARPLSLDKHIKYTRYELQTILRLLDQNYSFNAIADTLNTNVPKQKFKSASGIKGKLERMGFVFRGDMAIAIPVSIDEQLKDLD